MGCIRLRRFLVLISVIAGILSGCSNDKISFSEVSIDQVKQDAKEFILQIESSGNNKGNGIYLFDESEKVRYLYLNQDFLKSENGFGGMDINVNDDSWNIYLTESAGATNAEDEYKLYEIKLNKDYEYMKVFKNEKETYFESVGVKEK